MKKQFRQILSLLCVLTLALGCVASFALAEEADPAGELMESRIISVEWADNNNYDGVRPPSLDVELNGKTLTLNDANGWTGEVSVPAGTAAEWAFDVPEGYTVTQSGSDPVRTYRMNHATAPAIPKSAKAEWNDNKNAMKTRPESVQLVLKADGEPCGAPQTAKAPDYTVTWKGLRKYRPGTDTEIVYTAEQLTTPAGYTVSASGLTVTNTLQLGKLSLTASVSGAPEGTDLSALSLTVDGPDPSMPRTLTWGQLAGGFNFGDVLPGA